MKFWLTTLVASDFRCFKNVELNFEEDVTLLAAENGGGKTALLHAIAIQLAAWMNPAPVNVVPSRDNRHVRSPSMAWELAGICVLGTMVMVDGPSLVGWHRTQKSLDSKLTRTSVKPIRDLAARVLVPGNDWPVLGFYGTQRLWQVKNKSKKKAPKARHRLDGYVDCLDPRSSEAQLLEWLQHHALIEFQRDSRREPRLGQLDAVFDAMKRATPGVKEIYFDHAANEPRVIFDDQTESTWGALSDGYHVFLGLVADIARRAAILNDHRGKDAPLLSPGVVLVDEIDLHLHPRWQRTVIAGLRAAFPRIQFILTTHSPQVLGSVENRQVRRLVGHQVVTEPARVHGRDSNAILNDVMGAPARSAEGEARRRAVHDAIDDGRFDEAAELLGRLKADWGELDSAVIRAQTTLDWARLPPDEDDEGR